MCCDVHREPACEHCWNISNIGVISKSSVSSASLHSAFKWTVTNSTWTFHDTDGHQCGLLKTYDHNFRHSEMAPLQDSKILPLSLLCMIIIPIPSQGKFLLFRMFSPFQMVVYSLLNSYRRCCFKNPLWRSKICHLLMLDLGSSGGLLDFYCTH